MPLFNPPDHRKPGFRLTLFACALAVLVVGLGAFTRLVDAGLGCPDWPTCYGHVLWPSSAEEIARANEHPDFLLTPVETDKTWPEQVHRLFASTLGLVGLLLFAMALKRRAPGHPWLAMTILMGVVLAGTVARVVVGDAMDPYVGGAAVAYLLLLALWGWRYRASPYPLKLPALIAGLLVLQGLFGMWTVTLKLWPQVVTAHLLGGFATLSLLWLLALRLDDRHWLVNRGEMAQLQLFRPLAVIGLIVVIVQIALGGWTTANYAAVACPDFPTCQREWLPPMDFAHGFNIFQHVGPNYLGGTMHNEGRVAIHFAHRLGAIVTAAYLLMLCIALWRSGIVAVTTQARVIALVLVLQLSLGIANIVFRFPLSVAVAHNLGGALLLLTMVTLNYRIFTARLRQGEAG